MGKGPLSGVRVIELAGIGPGPFAAMLLADLGAEDEREHGEDGEHADPGEPGHAGEPGQLVGVGVPGLPAGSLLLQLDHPHPGQRPLAHGRPLSRIGFQESIESRSVPSLPHLGEFDLRQGPCHRPGKPKVTLAGIPAPNT